jgi:exopolyphosphatase / guanosine-5'-triphosphate,3'-diphosphate pyrophosphatase
MAGNTKTVSGNYQLKAVVDVGSTSIRMAVAQVHPDGSYKRLDSLIQSVAIGSDTFNRGEISRSTIEECVKVLRSFRKAIEEYSINIGSDVRAVATSAVSEASNRNEFLDRIYMATGVNVEVIDGTEVNRLTFMALKPILDRNPVLQSGKLLAVEAGGGSTEVLGIRNGRVFFAHSYRIGSYKLRELMDSVSASESLQIEALEAEIATGIRQMVSSGGKKEKDVKLLLMGGDARFAAGLLAPEWNRLDPVALKLGKLEKLAERTIRSHVEDTVRDHGLNLEEAQTLGPALKIYARMARRLKLQEVLVCSATLRDGLLAEAALGNTWTADFVKQILHSAEETGRRYFDDRNHADCVANNSVKLFQALQNEHGLEYKHQVLLTVAAQLHDIGVFISGTSHHKHSHYLIENSEIFGLSDHETRIVALVARYHRRALPKETHPEYSSLSREDRMVVSKLAAILRVADALDRSHMQVIRDPEIIPGDEAVYIKPGRNGSFSSERIAVASKTDLFERIFGRPAVLMHGGSGENGR